MSTTHAEHESLVKEQKPEKARLPEEPNAVSVSRSSMEGLSAGSVMSLQRSAGNAAVAQMLSIQRSGCGGGSCGCGGGCGGGEEAPAEAAAAPAAQRTAQEEEDV